MIALVLGLLFSGVGANVYLVYAAQRDPSFAVEPAYYDKAVRWDELQAERARSDALGWSARARASGSQLLLELEDAHGRPVADAEVELELFHNARAKDRRQDRARAVEGGYALDAELGRRGRWVVRVRATRAGEVFVTELEVERP